MCQLSWNLRVSAFWNPQGLSRPGMGLLYLYPCSPPGELHETTNAAVTIALYSQILTVPTNAQLTFIWMYLGVKCFFNLYIFINPYCFSFESFFFSVLTKMDDSSLLSINDFHVVHSVHCKWFTNYNCAFVVSARICKSFSMHGTNTMNVILYFNVI